MSKLQSTLVALALLCPLSACDGADDSFDEPRAVEDFQDGMTCDSDAGAFRVTLWSDSGELDPGQNNLVVRIAMPDPNDPEARGTGIPNAEIDLDAWMPTDDESMPSEPTVEYLGDGQYRLENVVLPDEGVWNFDFEVVVGANMFETISLAFAVD